MPAVSRDRLAAPSLSRLTRGILRNAFVLAAAFTFNLASSGLYIPTAQAIEFVNPESLTRSSTQTESRVSSDSTVDSAEKFTLEFGLRDLFTKLVDDHGNGDPTLYGVRNFRMVLAGVMYRGGANNAFNREGIRSNSNPLPNEGLQHLCEAGFDQAIYLYPTRFNTAPHTVTCKTRDGEPNRLTYFQYSPLAGQKNVRSILELLHAKLSDPHNTHPLFAHCWNGWHASGYISAVALRQFCGMSADSAVAYWNRNTDGNNKGPHYEWIRGLIRNYQVDPALAIPTDVKASICHYM